MLAEPRALGQEESLCPPCGRCCFWQGRGRPGNVHWGVPASPVGQAGRCTPGDWHYKRLNKHWSKGWSADLCRCQTRSPHHGLQGASAHSDHVNPHRQRRGGDLFLMPGCGFAAPAHHRTKTLPFFFAGYNPFFQETLVVPASLCIQAKVFRIPSLRTDKIVTVSSSVWRKSSGINTGVTNSLS